ncbi:MAG: glycosyltransferase family 2 protein [Akkermansiaceae bacterium]|nr:glycosyltransferase family 2 protein [Armatimonadota bacterium]
MPPDVSVVIVSYRVRDVLRDCLNSLFAGGGLDGVTSEIILVDNASGDGTAEMVCADFSPVRSIALGENRGFSGANNVGLAGATGRTLLLLNPDTLVPRGAIAGCVRYLDAQPADVGAMGCRVAGPNGVTQWECARRAVTPGDEIARAFLLDRVFPRSDRFNRERMPGWDRADERDVESLLGAFMLVRREAFATVGGLDERFFLMYEDTDYCTRLRQAGYHIRYYPEVTITHLGGQSWKQERVATYTNSHIAALQYMEKHFPRDADRVRRAHRLGMRWKAVLLRIALLRSPRNSELLERLRMTHSAYDALAPARRREESPA